MNPWCPSFLLMFLFSSISLWSSISTRSFYLTCLISSIFGMANAGPSTLAGLCVIAAFVGFGIGGNIPIETTITLEFLPTNRRWDALRFGRLRESLADFVSHPSLRLSQIFAFYAFRLSTSRSSSRLRDRIWFHSKLLLWKRESSATRCPLSKRREHGMEVLLHHSRCYLFDHLLLTFRGLQLLRDSSISSFKRQRWSSLGSPSANCEGQQSSCDSILHSRLPRNR